MNIATDPVLELLDEAPLAVTPGSIVFELQRRGGDSPSRRTIFRALDELEDRGYITRPQGDDGTLIEITERGREYLRGERDASEDA